MVAIAERLRKKKDLKVEVSDDLKKKLLENNVQNIINIDLY